MRVEGIRGGSLDVEAVGDPWWLSNDEVTQLPDKLDTAELDSVLVDVDGGSGSGFLAGVEVIEVAMDNLTQDMVERQDVGNAS